jgi:hypothetical protein
VEVMNWDDQGQGAIVQSNGKLVTNRRVTQRWFLEALQTFLKFDLCYSTGNAPAFQPQTSGPIKDQKGNPSTQSISDRFRLLIIDIISLFS